MNMMKKFLSAALAASMALSLAACGGSSTTAGDAGGSSPDALEVHIWDGTQLEGLQEIADGWTQQTGIDVNIQAMNWDEYWTLLEAGASGGQMPDVFWMHSNSAEMYMSNDMLLDLSSYIESSDEIDLANYYEDIVDLYSWDGKQYALPKDHDTIALLYNKAIFDTYGVAYPDETWTWEDFYEAGKTITEQSGGEVYGYAADVGNNQDGWWNIVYDFGGYIINDDKTQSGMDDPKTLEAMQFLGKLIDDTMPAQSVISETGTGTLFTSGVVAMNTQGSWNINTFYTADDSDDYAWALLPYWDANGNGQADEGERCSIYNGVGWAAADTDYPEEAWSLIEWFCNYDNQVKQADLGVTMAGYKGASDSYANAFEGMNIDAFLQMEDDGTLVPRPCSKYTTQWETRMSELLVDAWNDTSKMEDVCRQIAEDMNATLATE